MKDFEVNQRNGTVELQNASAYLTEEQSEFPFSPFS